MPAPRILVVEDDRDVARLIAAQLRGDGFEVVVNSSGGGVVEQAAGLEPQLVILDLMLPLAHGFEILTELRQEPRFSQLPVLILTALGAESDRVRGLDLGADDYIPKPFSPLELSARVRARLRAAPGTGCWSSATPSFAFLPSSCARRARLLPAVRSSPPCGRRSTSSPTGRWTFTSSGCAPRSKPTPSSPSG